MTDYFVPSCKSSFVSIVCHQQYVIQSDRPYTFVKWFERMVFLAIWSNVNSQVLNKHGVKYWEFCYTLRIMLPGVFEFIFIFWVRRGFIILLKLSDLVLKTHLYQFSIFVNLL